MVKKIKKDKVSVLFRPIIFSGGRYKFGNEAQKDISWSRKIIPDVKVGDEVAFHWDTLCQILSRKDVSNLKQFTQLTLSALS